MDSFATANQSPVGLIGSGSMREAWVPGKWNGNRSAIDEIDGQGVISYDNLCGLCASGLSCQSMPPRTLQEFPNSLQLYPVVGRFPLD